MKCFKLVETQVAEDELIFSLTSTGKVQKEVQSDKGQQGSEFSFLPCELTATFTNTAETEAAVTPHSVTVERVCRGGVVQAGPP